MSQVLLMEPKQSRSRETRDRICEATLMLLEEKPFDAITIDDIVVEAGCSTSSFYARFSSKVALLHFLQSRAIEDAEQVMEALEDVDSDAFRGPVELGTAILCGYMDFRRRHAALLRTLRALENDDARIRSRREQLDRKAFGAIKRAILRVLGAKPGGAIDTTLEKTMWVFPAAARAILDDPRHDGATDSREDCEGAVELIVRSSIPVLLDEQVQREAERRN